MIEPAEEKSDKRLERVRSLLFLPASNPRAIAKARASAADLVILDLEDAVKPDDKDAARAAAVAAVAEPWPMPVAIRINAPWEQRPFASRPSPVPSVADCEAVAGSAADFVVVPKAETGIEDVGGRTGKPVLAMIETPLAVLTIGPLLGHRELAGLIVGTNDLAAELRVAGPDPRAAMSMALQSVVCAARAAGIPAWDGVYNRLDDPAGFEAECRAGLALGFDGKSLIHPDQIATCNRVFSPSAEEIADAQRILAAATGGAERFEGRMIEGMHVEAARRVLFRAGLGESA